MKNEDTKEITKKEKPAKPAKAPKAPKQPKAKKEPKPPKEVKKLPAKKLPKLFKKAYTQKQFDKSIIGKLFIPEDQNYLKALFKPAGQNKKGVELLAIPQDMMFEKKELARLETMAKEIKLNKGRIKLLPLVATVAFIAAVIITLSLTKNLIARKVITSTCESIFEAKCDIDYLNISFIKSSFRMKGWQVANKKQPMKNLFSVESVTFDFDMLQLLKARFVANELSVLGVDTNTDRTYTGDISAQRLAKIQKKKEKEAKKKAKQNEKSAFMVSLDAKKDAAMDTLKDSISGLFDEYNPEKIIKDCQDQLKTPVVSKQVQDDAKALVEKYKAKPDEIKTKLEKVKSTADTLANLDVSAIQSNPTKIKEALESVNTVKTNLDSLKRDADSMLNDMKGDIDGTVKMAAQIQDAINSDKTLIETQVNKFTSINLDTGKSFITGTFDSVIYQLLGKYYPYYTKAVDYLMQAKNNAKDKPKKEKKEKKKYTIVRAEGRDVYYKNDAAPKLWIKKAAGSGPMFAFDASDISSNMDITGKPATANITATLLNIDHKAKLTVDTRSNSSEPLVLANYNCDKLSFEYPASKFGSIPGVPGIDSTKTQLDFILKFFENDGFSLTGTSYFTELALSAPAFEPAFINTIYANTLAKINQMRVGVTAGFTQTSGVELKLDSDVDKQFISAFTAEMTNQIGEIKAKVEEQMFAKINEFSGGALGEINNFNDITAKLKDYENSINEIYKKIDAKKKELEDATVGKAKSAATDAANKATEKAKDAAKSKLKNLF